MTPGKKESALGLDEQSQSQEIMTSMKRKSASIGEDDSRYSGSPNKL